MSETEIATVLPKELRLGVPPKMPQARSYLFRQQSTIASYSPGGTIQINIPRLQRSYLRKDSYLRFTVSGNWTPQAVSDVIALDTCGAWGLFEKMEVFDYLGSTVLESISGVPQLMSLLLDLGLDGILDKTKGNTSYGLAQDYGMSTTAAYKTGINGTVIANPDADGTTARALATAIPVGTSFNVVPPSAGIEIDRADGTAKQSWSFEFSIPLCSFLGFLSDKMIPLHNGFTIILTLASQNKPFIISQDYSLVGPTAAIAGTATAASDVSALTVRTTPVFNWNVSSVQMEMQILELGPVAESMIMSSTQGQPLIVHTKAMRYYTGSVKGSTNNSTVPGTSEFNLNLNLNVASLTNILWFMRNSGSKDVATLSSCGHRTRNCLQRWYFQYGSTTLPQNNGIQSMYPSLPTLFSTDATSFTTVVSQYPLIASGGMEAYNELMKARPCYLGANRINYANYLWDASWNKSLDKRNPSIGALNLLGLYPGTHNPFNIGRFACGLNLELAPNKSGSIISGLNTNGMNTSIRGQFHPNYLVNMDDVDIDAYAEYDAFINISPGIATTVSF